MQNSFSLHVDTIQVCLVRNTANNDENCLVKNTVNNDEILFKKSDLFSWKRELHVRHLNIFSEHAPHTLHRFRFSLGSRDKEEILIIYSKQTIQSQSK